MQISSLLSFFVSLWSAPQPFSFWYLYMYAGFIVMLPLLRKLVIYMQQNDFIYYLIVLALVGTIPYIAMYLHLPPISAFFQIPLFTFLSDAGGGVSLFMLFYIRLLYGTCF